jgi:prolyl-tRNA synthetase
MQNTIKASQLFPATLRDTPADASTPGHRLLLRAGFMRPLTSGVYFLSPLAMRVLHKIERIVREEMNSINGLEVNLPILQPAELWKQTGRWNRYVRDGIMLHGRDRHNQEYGLAPTAEELVTYLAAQDLQSYGQLPLTLWQLDWKFRDELRPRMGLIRSRMFRMKDSYSFDIDEEGMRHSYNLHRAAYENMFRRMGFRFISVQADSGAIGGKGSAEFMVTSEHGEDVLLTCTACDYGANQEKAESIIPAHSYDRALRPMRKVATPNIRTVDQLEKHFNLTALDMIKTLIYLADDRPIAICCRGDLAINEVKLANILDCATLQIAPESVVREVTGAPVGFAGPQQLRGVTNIIFDGSTSHMTNFLCGCNEEDFHLFDVNFGRDIPTPTNFCDVHTAQAGHRCPVCSAGILQESKGIEVGHIFMLQQGYAQKLNLTYLGPDGIAHTPWMGCYGVGTTRCLQALAEQNNDKDGLKWPEIVAPFSFVIVPTAATDGSLQFSLAQELFAFMRDIPGMEVVFDDRSIGFGAKMKDALLIGYPYLLVIGRNAISGEFELQTRADGCRQTISIHDFKESLLTGRWKSGSATSLAKDRG